MQGLEDLLNIESNDAEAIASTYFSSASVGSFDTDSESQYFEPFKEVDLMMKVEHSFVLDRD